MFILCFLFFFQAEDGIRDLVRSRGLGDVYKRQVHHEADRPAACGGDDQRIDEAHVVAHDHRGAFLLSLIHI